MDEIEPRDYVDLIKKVKAPKVDNTPLKPVTIEDVNILVKTCGKDWHGQRDRAAILALLDSGARAREFLALDVANVNLRIGAVLICYGKGGKSRTVFIDKTTHCAARSYLQMRIDGPL